MRYVLLSAVVIGFLAGCYATSEKEYVARMNADKRVWPPVVEGQPYPVQEMWSEH